MDSLKLPDDIVEIFTKNDDPIEVNEAGIQKFLGKTHHVGYPQAERLRRLAITLEYDTFKDGWKGLRKLYETAHALEPDDVTILHSWAIAANRWYDQWSTPKKEDRIAIANEGKVALQKAITLSPNDDRLYYTLGHMYYDHPLCNDQLEYFTKKALECFSKATMINPQHQMARLYQAHCYHDLKEYHTAYTIYLQVNTEQLIQENPLWRWRVIKLKEQVAHCCAMMERIDEAKDRVDAFLTEVEQMSCEEHDDLITDFDEAVEIFFVHALSDSNLRQRLVKLIKQLQFEDFYSKELLQIT